jgi:hypothetical protein
MSLLSTSLRGCSAMKQGGCIGLDGNLGLVIDGGSQLRDCAAGQAGTHVHSTSEGPMVWGRASVALATTNVTQVRCVGGCVCRM